MKKTYSAKPTDVQRKWYVIDASEAPLGRVASRAAQLLIGKSKPTYTPHIDGGDYVVVVNAGKFVITGDKLRGKMYYRHSQFPGNLKEYSLKQMAGKKPEFVVENAVHGMLPKNKLSKLRMARLKVYAGETHEHEAQKPVKYTIKKGNNGK